MPPPSRVFAGRSNKGGKLFLSPNFLPDLAGISLIDPAAAADDGTEGASFSVFRNKTSEMPFNDGRRRLDSVRKVETRT